MNIKETYKYIRKNDLKGKKHNKSYYHIAIDIIRFRIRGIAYGDWEYGDILEYKNKKWIVYYKERDTISMYKEFDDEKQACEEYLKRLKDLKYIQ